MTKVHSPHRLIGRVTATVASAIVISVLAASTAHAQSAATAFQRAQTREQVVRKQAAPSVTTLRSIATSYEVIVRKHPASGVCDNALWQAAGMLQLAFERSGAPRDRDAAVKMLQWLKREYPTSSFAKQVDDRVAALAPRRAPVTVVAPTKERQAPAASPTPAPRVTTPQPALPPKGAAVATASFETPASVKAAPLAPLPVVFREYPIALRETTYTTLPRGERITIELSAEVSPAVERAGDQMLLKLPGVGVAPTVVDATTKLHGTLVRAVRINPAADGLNLKLDLASTTRYSTFPLYDPYRLVIDFDTDDTVTAAATPVAPAPPPVALKPATRTASAAVSVAPPSTPAPVAVAPAKSAAEPKTTEVVSTPMPPANTRDGGYSLARQLGLGVSRIVIDPGHGGHDPGAQANGVSEAELVLDVGLRTVKVGLTGFDQILDAA